MNVEAVSLPPVAAVAAPAPDAAPRGKGGPDFLQVLEAVADPAWAAGEMGGTSGMSPEPQAGGGPIPAIPPGDVVPGPLLALSAPPPAGSGPARAGPVLVPQVPGPALLAAAGAEPLGTTTRVAAARDGALGQSAAEAGRAFAPAPSSRAAVPDAVNVDPPGPPGRGGRTAPPATGPIAGASGAEASPGATAAREGPSRLARGEAVAAGAGTAPLPDGLSAVPGNDGAMTGSTAPQTRQEIPLTLPGGPRAGGPDRATGPERMETAADPVRPGPGAGLWSDTAPSTGEAARGGPWQAPGSDRPLPEIPLAASAGAGPAGGDALAPDRPEVAKGMAGPAEAAADPPQPVAADPASPRRPILSGAEAGGSPPPLVAQTLATQTLAAQVTAASAPESDDRGTGLSEPAPLAPPAGARPLPELTEGRMMPAGNDKAKPDAATSPVPVLALAVEPAPGAPLPDGAGAFHGTPGTRSPEEGASGGAPATAQDPARSVATQLAAAVSVDRRGVFEIRLSPEELGVVKLTLQVADGTVALAIEAERPETLELMRRNLDVLEREFRDAGFASLNLSFGHRGGDRTPEGPAVYASAVEDHPAPADTPRRGHHAPMPRAPSTAQLDLRL